MADPPLDLPLAGLGDDFGLVRLSCLEPAECQRLSGGHARDQHG